MQAAVRDELHQRGVVRNHLPVSIHSGSITQQMLPGAFHSALRDSVADIVSRGGKRACRMHGPAEGRMLQGAMVAPHFSLDKTYDMHATNKGGSAAGGGAGGQGDRDEGEVKALHRVTATASAVVCADATMVRFSVCSCSPDLCKGYGIPIIITIEIEAVRSNKTHKTAHYWVRYRLKPACTSVGSRLYQFIVWHAPILCGWLWFSQAQQWVAYVVKNMESRQKRHSMHWILY